MIWNPIAGLDARSPRPAQAFYPATAYVDMVGNDMFASRAGVASHAANEALYRAHPGKPYALPEWGLSIDDPGFVKKICTFLKTRPRTKLAAYYDARPGSPYDLGSKPAARAEYRRCITPLGAKASVRPPGPPTSAQLRLAADPAKGDAPLDVSFETVREPAQAGAPLGARVRRRQGAAAERPAARDGDVHVSEGRRLHGDADRLPRASVHRRRRSATSPRRR